MPRSTDDAPLEDEPLWYKDAVFYEMHVRAFYDGSGDGIGDFSGLSEKLDYIRDLGVNAIWLLPFFPSPWKDDGYDTSNYVDVHPVYGTLRDFHTFLREAHQRGLRVITELVLNHTSDQHVWFQRSRRAQPGSRWRNFYVWSNTPDKYRDARIIFKDFETSNWTWDPVGRAYYWHRFYSHQPDLNYDNPEVQAEMLDAMDFWLDMGIDGLRLDAVPYLFERESTTCENLPETHSFLKVLRRHVDSKYRNRMLLAEANQWPEDAISYFGQGDECHMAFHFPLMPRLFMAIRMEDRYPITEILELTPPVPDSSQWALFLRNHDELTLEMVTDEERDYMYRVYARPHQARINLGIRRRLAPLLGNDRRRIELMNALLLSLPGTPVIYYGDEIGMGDNIYLGDRNGVRTPMQWSADRNAGFSRANPQGLYLPVIIDPEYHYESINVETQQANPHSLLWWMKRIISQRKRSRAFGRGSLEFLRPDNRRVLAFLRQYQEETILVVANLSRFVQSAHLDLGRFQGSAPVEMFGRTEFPAITERPYFLSLGPHSFYWFQMERKETGQETLAVQADAGSLPVLYVASWDNVFSPAVRARLNRLMPAFLRARRWFLGKGGNIRLAEITDVIPAPQTSSYVLLIRVEHGEGDPEFYVLPLAVATGEKMDSVLRELSHVVMAHLEDRAGTRGVLYGALWERDFHTALLAAIARRRRWKGEAGELLAAHTQAFRRVWGPEHPELEPNICRGDQNHTCVQYSDRFVLKLFRKIESGRNPELELGRFLTEKVAFPNSAPLAGSLEYRRPGEEPMAVAALEGFVHAEADGWRYTLDHLSLFFEHALAVRDEAAQAQLSDKFSLLHAEPVPPLVAELIGSYLDMAGLLGQRTAEMHLALAGGADDPALTPEPFTDFYRHGLYHRMIGQVIRCFGMLLDRLPAMEGDLQQEARKLLESDRAVRARFQLLRDRRIAALRTRDHGDYHLRQVLYTGKDFVIIDFEGDPRRPISERRIKRSPLWDVAVMLRSFHYAAHGALFGQVSGVDPHAAPFPVMHHWAGIWYKWVSETFLAKYLATARAGNFLPVSGDEIKLLLESFLMERALVELASELDNRPEWVRIPIYGILGLLESG